MTRIEFIRNTGRWMMVLGLLAAGGFLIASHRISRTDYCAADSNCAGCGLRRVCNPPEDYQAKTDEKE
jgi:hypothetical protein